MDAAVNGLSRPARIVPSLQELGKRHANYGVKDHHYGTVGTALLWMLGKVLGAEFTPEAKDAWATVYGVLATTMREAAATALCERRLPPHGFDGGGTRRRYQGDSAIDGIDHYSHKAR